MKSTLSFRDFNPDCVLDPADLDPWRALFWSHNLCDNGYLLYRYCTCRALAMEHRLTGDIPAVIYWEQECDSIYAQLPPSLRW